VCVCEYGCVSVYISGNVWVYGMWECVGEWKWVWKWMQGFVPLPSHIIILEKKLKMDSSFTLTKCFCKQVMQHLLATKRQHCGSEVAWFPTQPLLYTKLKMQVVTVTNECFQPCYLNTKCPTHDVFVD